jgi:hypothetical protein
MTILEGTDLHSRVERYEAAVAEMRAVHEDVRDILLDQVLFERWEQLGAELGFRAQQPRQAEMAMQQPAPSWAG